MKQKLVLFITLLLFISCSQKTPTIDGQANKFAHKFYSASIDRSYSPTIKVDDKYPLIFLFSAFEGTWNRSSTIKKLQKMGYHVVTIGYYDNYGLSNNLSRININGLKYVMDNYKKIHSVDKESIGIIGKGKGAELALVVASLYSDIKMVVGVSASHVVFQASNVTLLNYSSWVHNNKELDFVKYPKFNISAIKSIYRLIVQKDDYRKLHFLALEDKEAVEKARIKVENINGAIYLASATRDKLWPSTTMSKEIMKRLKEKKFTHNYVHKAYDSSWFLSGHPKAWSEIYGFIAHNLKSSYTPFLFNFIDKNRDKKISKDEYVIYMEILKEKVRKERSAEIIHDCDKNRDKKISFDEVRERGESLYTGDDRCFVFQDSFYNFDKNSDKIITEEELNIQSEPRGYQPSSEERKRVERYRVNGAKERVKQCDKDGDNGLSKIEATSKECQITLEVFRLMDSDKNGILNLDEVTAIPSKYARYREPIYYIPNIDNETFTPIPVPLKKILEIDRQVLFECDTNHDNQLTKDEVTIKSCGFTSKEFNASDLNQDGVYSHKDEIYTQNMREFNSLDSNKDGVLDFDESFGMY